MIENRMEKAVRFGGNGLYSTLRRAGCPAELASARAAGDYDETIRRTADLVAERRGRTGRRMTLAEARAECERLARVVDQ